MLLFKNLHSKNRSNYLNCQNSSQALSIIFNPRFSHTKLQYIGICFGTASSRLAMFLFESAIAASGTQ